IRASSLVYYDIKIIDENLHRAYCGVDNKRIISNFEFLIKSKEVQLPETRDTLNFKHHVPDVPLLVPRMPLVPGITATAENMARMVAFLARNHVKVMDLLPYNPLWMEKATSIGKVPGDAPGTWCSKDVLDGARDAFRGFTFDRFK
nr:hypothetical protein [Candidatus Sigynarchaeota archaeon]